MPSVASRYADITPRRSVAQGVNMPMDELSDLKAPVVLMVSGGADSTALLVLAANSTLDIADGRGKAHIARERLHVLHVNHQLRGIDAQEDEEFVCELALRYGIPCTVRRADVAALAAAGDGNVENAGRELRYAAAAELANMLSDKVGTPRSAARILTAHTADDRAETFFMNALRGTGLAGLASIPRRRNRIVRPLLDFEHDELCNLLTMRGIVWREDKTNSDTRYLRSYVRHKLLPVAKERNARLSTTLSATCDILSDEDAYLTQLAARALRELTRRQDGGMIALDAGRLAASEVVIARRVVKQVIARLAPGARVEARHINALLQLVAAGSGSVQVVEGIDARVEYGLLFVRARRIEAAGELAAWLEVPSPHVITTAPDARGTLSLSGGRTLVARLATVPRGADPVALARAHGKEWAGASVLLDAVACGVDPERGGRLWVDAPSAGDVLCPLGMHGQSKKLSDLLNEAKIPAADRAGVPILRTGPRGQIVWIAGIRADERVRCTSHTRELLELDIIATEDLPGGQV